MTSTRTHSMRLRLGWALLGYLAAATALAAPPELPAWDQLSDDQRELLIAPTRERWDANPARRQQLLERARHWQRLGPEQRKHAHHGVERWEHMSPDQRTHARALYRVMRPLDPAAREAFKARWRAMTPEQKNAWLEANPAPERGNRKTDR